MKTIWKVLLALAVLVGVLLVFIQWKSGQTYDAPYPTVKASTDSAIIARGEYLAYGPAHCADCHGDTSQRMAFMNGEHIPLSGGLEFHFPPGIIRAPNITPDEETGLGKVSDAQLARAMRSMVGHKGNLMFPLMPFQNLSEEDLVAVMSFIRAQKPVKNKVAPSEYNMMGKTLIAFGLIKPEGGKPNPPMQMVKEPSVAYGKYLAHSVANCVGCHTERDLKTGAFIGEEMAGGTVFGPDNLTRNHIFISPNLTPDPATGLITSWTEAQFINRLQKGRIHDFSPMAWEAYKNLDSVDCKALYAYIRSLKPVNKSIAKVMYLPGEKPAP